MYPYHKTLRELRIAKKMKQTDIANLLGTTQQVYSRYEKGLNALPIRHLLTLCEYYHISADDFLDFHLSAKKASRAQNDSSHQA